MEGLDWPSLLAPYGPSALIIVGLAWWGMQERSERRANQQRLDQLQEKRLEDMRKARDDISTISNESSRALDRAVSALRDGHGA